MAPVTLTPTGRMSTYDTTLLNAEISRKKITWGSIVRKERWVEIAGPETHLTEYFTKNKLWGYLSADPGYYSLEEVFAFMNDASYDEEKEVISCTLKNENVRFTKKKFAKVFGLEYRPTVGEIVVGLPDVKLRRGF